MLTLMHENQRRHECKRYYTISGGTDDRCIHYRSTVVTWYLVHLSTLFICFTRPADSRK